jgi:hypothetical protein
MDAFDEPYIHEESEEKKHYNEDLKRVEFTALDIDIILTKRDEVFQEHHKKSEDDKDIIHGITLLCWSIKKSATFGIL